MGVRFKHCGFLVIGLSWALALLVLPAAQIAHAATFTVNTTNDTVDANPGDGICADANGACSLRAAIREANALTGTDTVTVPAGVYTLTIAGAGEQQNATGDLDIRSSLDLVGAGAASTIIQAGSSGGVSGDGIDRVLEVIGAITVNISDVTIRYGRLGSGAAGGGLSISSGGVVTLDECIVADNYVASTNFGGGGIFLFAGSLTIDNSALVGNVHGNIGGGVFNDNGNPAIANAVIINNSTFSANSSGQGGAIASDGPLTLSNSTFYGNSATTGGDIANNASTVTLQNSILAASSGGACTGFAGTSTNNLVSDGSCGIAANAATNLDSTLANNGGQTPTHALLTSSNAIDAGASNCPDNTATPLVRDQRNYARPAGAGCDIGAFEANSTPLAVQLASFEATNARDHVLIAWETVSELNNLGFNLYRGQTPDAPEAWLAFVPAQSPGSAPGAIYRWMDAGVAAGETYHYWLEDIDLSGAATLHGPVSVTHEGPTAVAVTGFTAAGKPSVLPALAALAAGLGVALAWSKRRLRPS